MPIQLTWQPNTGPTIKPNSNPALVTDDITERGLEITGEDPAIKGVVDGRVKLLEVAGKGKGAGTSEASLSRVIASFHGKFHSDPKAPRDRRVTFEIFIGSATVPPHGQDVQGFDPECVFGVDALVLTFVNREFIIFFPFHVDTVREGSFLEIVAVAEIGAIGSATELARSSVLSLGIRRVHAVETTTNDKTTGTVITYSGDQIGNRVLTPEGYILNGGVKSPASTADEILLTSVIVEVRLPNPGLTFSPYRAGSLKILLLKDLLDNLVPPDSFLIAAIPGVTAATVGATRTDAVRRFRALQVTVAELFVDAGFTGAQTLWSDEAAAAAQLQAFTKAFTRQALRGNFWRLLNSKAPLDTLFWNFFVGSSDQNQEAGTGERVAGAPIANPVVHKIDGRDIFLHEVFPVGSGNKRLTNPIEIATGVFKDLLMIFSGNPRTYASTQAFGAAVDKVAGKLAILIAHEVAHSLGLMHHSKVVNKASYTEKFGSPVLSIMSSGVESGGFGTGITFSAQAKVLWATAFGVTSQPDDAFLQNKVWSDKEVFTLNWGARKQRFKDKHGEGVLKPVQLDSGQTPPPFAKAAPDAQRGTFAPKP